MSKLSGIFSLRNFVKKQLMKTNDQGIMTLPDKGKVDFGEMMIREELFLRGIDPTLIKDEKVLEGILNTPIVKPKVAPKKPGEVIEVDFDKGRWKDTEPEKFFYGGFVEQPELGQTAHGSEALASRTRLAAPGSTSTTSTGLNYLLAEDNDNQRVPFEDGGDFKQFQKEKMMQLMQEYQQYLKNREIEKRQRPYMEKRMGTGPGPILEAAEGGRIGFSKGKGVDLLRRGFLKTMGVAGAGIAALKTGLLGLGKGTTKQVAKDLTQVPIGDPPGMPPWFKPLVNRVIKEGDDMTKQFATKEREIVHATKIGDDDYVRVTQDLDSGNVRVEYEGTNTMGEQSVQLEYKASEEIPLKGGKGSARTTEEFSAVESEPRVVNWDGDIEFDGENVVGKVDDLLSDTTKLETYATGKKPNIKKLLKSKQKQKYVNNLHDDQLEQVNYIENKEGYSPMEYIDESERVGAFKNTGPETKGMNLPNKIKKASGGIARMLGE